MCPPCLTWITLCKAPHADHIEHSTFVFWRTAGTITTTLRSQQPPAKACDELSHVQELFPLLFSPRFRLRCLPYYAPALILHQAEISGDINLCLCAEKNNKKLWCSNRLCAATLWGNVVSSWSVYVPCLPGRFRACYSASRQQEHTLTNSLEILSLLPAYGVMPTRSCNHIVCDMFIPCYLTSFWHYARKTKAVLGYLVAHCKRSALGEGGCPSFFSGI